jgi:cation transport ATPase
MAEATTQQANCQRHDEKPSRLFVPATHVFVSLCWVFVLLFLPAGHIPIFDKIVLSRFFMCLLFVWLVFVLHHVLKPQIFF